MTGADHRERLLELVRGTCDELPEVTVRSDPTTDAFEVRRRIVAYVSAVDDPNGEMVVLLVVNADPDERHALLATGHPYFAPNSGRDRLGIVIDGTSDPDELRELVIDSYRLAAPKKLTARLDD